MNPELFHAVLGIMLLILCGLLVVELCLLWSMAKEAFYYKRGEDPLRRFPAVIWRVESAEDEVIVILRMLKRDFSSLKQHEQCMAMLDVTRSIMLDEAIIRSDKVKGK